MKNALTPRTLLIRTAAVAFILTGFTIGAVPADALGVGVGTGGTVNTPLVSGGINNTTGTSIDTKGRPVTGTINNHTTTTTGTQVQGVSGGATSNPKNIGGTMQQDNQNLRTDSNANLRSDTRALNNGSTPNTTTVNGGVNAGVDASGGLNGTGVTLGTGVTTNTGTSPSTAGTTKY